VRAFIALDLPYDIKNFITVQLFALKTKFDYKDIKWVETQNYHITFRFFENINENEAIDKFNVMKQKLTVNPQKVNIKGLNFFSLRVIFLDLEPKEFFYNLYEQIAEVFGKQDKQFFPHITIGRVKKKLNFQKEKYLREFVFNEISFVADEICLFKSVLTSYGPIYEKLIAFKLKDYI